MTPTPPRPPFEVVDSWAAAAALVVFRPRAPRDTGGASVRERRVFVRDHRGRELPAAARTLDTDYGTWAFSQSQHTIDEARRLVFERSYGAASTPVTLASGPGRAYASGPAPAPGDADGQLPAVVVWHDGPMFYCVSSAVLPLDRLIAIGDSFAPVTA